MLQCFHTADGNVELGVDQKRGLPVCNVELRADRKRLRCLRFQISSPPTFGINRFPANGEEWANFLLLACCSQERARPRGIFNYGELFSGVREHQFFEYTALRKAEHF